MRAYVFDPLWPIYLTSSHKEKLDKANVEVMLTTEVKPLKDFEELYRDKEPKILALNPDFVSWSLTKEDFKEILGLKAIITESTSYGWIDTEYAKSINVLVLNIRNFSTEAVAEWAVMMMMNIARKIPLLMKNRFPINFGSDFQTYQGMNLKGKKVGIVGLGNIGSAIAHRCHGLGMDVLYWSQSTKTNTYTACDLPKLFKESDIIFPAMADNGDTKAIITDTMLASMKPDSMFISIVHKYYNHALLLKMVEEGALYGYGFEDEHPATFNNYKGNVWAAPAYAWCTKDSLTKSMDLFVDAICQASQGNFVNQVNL